jgi:hypothetical protein
MLTLHWADSIRSGIRWRKSDGVRAICAAILVFVWPLPNVIVLRIILLLGLLLFLASELVRKLGLRAFPAKIRWIAALLAVLAIWLFVVAFVVTDNPASSLGKLKGGWLRTFAAFTVGLLLPAVLQARRVDMALLFLTASFAARSFLDSALRDHILEEFMFFVGLLLAASSQNKETLRAGNAQ